MADKNTSPFQLITTHQKDFTMIDSRTAPYAALIMRLALGLMFVAHGLTKVFVFTPAGTVGFFQSIGFPGFLAYPVMAFEVIGGLMLVLGVYTRSVAALAVIQLFVASTVHFANGWSFTNPNGGWEYPIYLAVTALVVALLGEGAFAVKSSKA
jgi:putative oxidoreductase